MESEGSQQRPSNQSSSNSRSTSSHIVSRDLEASALINQSGSSVVNPRALCSQPGCRKSREVANYLGFCVDCHTNYISILFEDRDQQGLQRKTQHGGEVGNGSSNYTSTYSISSLSNSSTTFSRTTGISQKRTTGITSVGTTGTSSTITTCRTYLRSIEDLFSDQTMSHGTASTTTGGTLQPSTTDTSFTRTTGSTYSSSTYDPFSDYTMTHGTVSTITGIALKPSTTPTSSTRTTGRAYSSSTDDPFNNHTMADGTVSARTMSLSSTRTEGSAYGSASIYNAGISVDPSLPVSTNTHESHDSRTKRYHNPRNTNEVIVKNMRDTLLCPSCLELPKDAKTLPCQHFLCHICLVQWVASKGELICPTCNASHPLPSGGVEGLPSNFTVNNLVADVIKLDIEEATDAEIFDDEEDEDDEEAEPSDEEAEPSLRVAMTDSFPNEPHSHFPPSYKNWKNIPSRETSFIEVLGKKSKMQGWTVKLKLQLRNEEGKPVRWDSKCRIGSTLVRPNGDQVPITNIHPRKKRGDFTVSFVAEMMGVFSVVVTQDGVDLRGSPAKILVRPKGKISGPLATSFITAPKGVAVLHSKYIYVTDESGNVCICIDPDGFRCFELDRPNHKDFRHTSPFGIAKSNNKLFITDSANSCVYLYIDKKYVNNFGKRVFEQPSGIAVTKDGTIFVADSGTNTVDIFRANFSHVRSIDLKGRGSVTHLALNKTEDRIVVADEKANVIKIVDVINGIIVKQIKTRISQAPATPFGVALDNKDNIFVSVTFDQTQVTRGQGAARNCVSKYRGAVIAYNSDGYYLGTIGEKELINPRGIYFVDDPAPELFILEAGYGGKKCSCIRVFRP